MTDDDFYEGMSYIKKKTLKSEANMIIFKKVNHWKQSGNSDIGVIYHAELTGYKEIFAFLHELGHKALNHGERRGDFINSQVVKEEIEAWNYALRCIKSAYQANAVQFALDCIATYNSAAEISTGDYLSKEEIINLLK